MGASERLTLLLENKVLGTEDLAKVEQAINRIVAAGDKAGKAPASSEWEAFGNKLKGAVSDPLASLSDVAGGVAKSLGPVGIGLTALVGIASAGATAFVSMAESLGDSAEAALNMSIRTGLTTKEVGQFTRAAQLAGVDTGAFEGAMKKLGTALGDTGEDGRKAREAMASLKVALYDTNGQLLPAGQLWLNLSGAISGVEDPFKRSKLAMDIFGKSGKELLPLLLELKDSAAELKSLGFGFDEKTAHQLDDTADTLKKIDFVWSKLLTNAKIDLVLSLKTLVEGAYETSKDLTRKGSFLYPYPEEDFISRAKDRKDKFIDGIKSGIFGIEPARDPNRFGKYIPSAPAAPVFDKGVQDGIDAFLRANGGNGIEELQRRESKAKQDVEASRTKLEGFRNTPGISSDAVSAEEANLRKLSAAYQVLGDSVKAAQRAEQERQKIFEAITGNRASNKLDREIRSAGIFDLPDGPGGLRRRFDGNLSASDLGPEFKKYLEQTSRTGFNLDFARSAVPAIDKEVDAALETTAKMFVKADRELKQRFRDDIDKLTDQATGITEKIATTNLESFKGVRTGSLERDITSTGQFGAFNLQRAAIANSGPGQERQAIGSELAIRQDTAQKIFDIEVKRITYLNQFEPEATRNAKFQLEFSRIQGDLQKENLQAQLDGQLKLIELDKQREQGLRNTGEQFTRALFGGQAGISSFFKNEFESIASKIGGNAFATFGKGLVGSLSIGGQKNADGTPNTLGKLLAGTPLGLDPLKGATDLNTIATVANTQALQVFAGVATGTAGGAGGAAGIGGFARLLGPSGTSGFAGPVGDGGGVPGDGAPDVASPASGTNAASPGIFSGKFSKTVGYAGAIAGGAFGVYSGVKQGGVRGGLTAGSSLASASAAILGLAGISGPAAPILAGVGLGLSLIQSFLPDPRKQREAQINKYLEFAKYNAPVAQTVTSDVSGYYSDRDLFGNVRGSKLSPFPTIQQPYVDRYNGGFFNVPGMITNPGGDLHVHIHATDLTGARAAAPVIGRALAESMRAGQQGHIVGALQQRL